MSDFTLLRLDAVHVEDIMTRDPVHIFEESSLEDAARVLSERSFSAMPVLRADGTISGVITQTDVVRAAAEVRKSSLTLDSDADGPPPDRRPGTVDLDTRSPTRVRDVMTPAVIAVAPDDPVGRAIGAMTGNAVRRVFVIDESRLLVGVLSAIDIIHRLEVED